jgi:enamine deaminase RidA (YjgF/YER057c/UK114 family)
MVMKMCFLFSFFVFFISFVGCENVIKPNKKESLDLYNYDVEQKITTLNIVLPEPSSPVANYVPAVSFLEDKLLYLSGTGPKKPDGSYIVGTIGLDLSKEEGYEAAKLAGINLLARLKKELGDLNRVKRIVKVTGMVNSTKDFNEQPAVINGFSDLMVDVFGERGRHSRSAIGMVSLPMNIAVEIEMLIEIN